jgi:preprotein translocase subunit SecG
MILWRADCCSGDDEEFMSQESPEDFMTKKMWYVGALAALLSAGVLNAQSSQTQTPDAQAQQSTQPPTADQPAPPPTRATPSQAPDQASQPAQDSQMQSAQPSGTQSFSGTIVKAGNKYQLQDEASGKSYDIDHQDEVQKFEGKRVRVKGTLDASGTMIHLQ